LAKLNCVSGNLKKETKGLLMAAQNQALRTNGIKVKIDKQEGDVRCTICARTGNK